MPTTSKAARPARLSFSRPIFWTIAILGVVRVLRALAEGLSAVLRLFFNKKSKDELQRLRGELWEAKEQNERAQKILAARARTMDRLLEFSHTIQGAGQSDQIFSALAYFLQGELDLAGLVIATYEAEAIGTTTIKAAFPASAVKNTTPGTNGNGAAGVELNATLCPCLRQNLPREFRQGTPVRCAIDQYLTLGDEHPAYCIPFNIGRKIQVVVHMLLKPGANWDEEKKQLAQTYMNTAQSSLVSLGMLEEAEKQSMTDSLTGLFNRRSMDRLLQREIALAERHSHAMSIVMIDMDKFKEINDAHGHAAGDHLLRAFADCVRMTLRKTDLAFRYGGDEFVIALPQTPVAQAQQVVQKLRQAFAVADFSDAIAKLEEQPTLSIGVAERSKAGNILSLQSLLNAADQALYEAKNDSRNCVKVFQSAA